MPGYPKPPNAANGGPRDAHGDGFLRRSADMPLRFGEGVNDTIKSMCDFFGADNPVSQTLEKNSQWYTDLLSAQASENDREVARILGEAKNEGILDQVAAGLQAFTVAPADFLASGAGSIAPFLAAGVLSEIGGLGYLGAGAVQSALSAGVQVGTVKSEIYKGVKQELLDKGCDEERARSTAMEAQRYGGKNTDQLLVAAGLGLIDGQVGAHRVITQSLTRGGLSAARARVSSVLREGIWQGVTEGSQGGQERLAGNLSLSREGFGTPLGSGVAAGAFLEGTVGVFMGGGAAAVAPHAKAEIAEVGGGADPEISGGKDDAEMPKGEAGRAGGEFEDKLKELLASANDWDRSNRHYIQDEWFEGSRINPEGRRGFSAALAAGGDSIQAHGMGKEMTLGGGIRNLVGMMRDGLDPNRRGGELDTAPVVSRPGEGLVGATASGSAYSDGPFMILQKPGTDGLKGKLENAGAILVNEANADLTPRIREVVQRIRPDIAVDSYGNAGEVVGRLRSQFPENGGTNPHSKTQEVSLANDAGTDVGGTAADVQGAAKNPDNSTGKNTPRHKLSPSKKKALGLEGNPAGVFLVASQPQIFQGVGTQHQYQEKLEAALSKLERKIDNGEFLNKGFDDAAFARVNGYVPSREYAEACLKETRKEQLDVQRGWRDYLRDGGYTPEHRFILLSSIVKEISTKENGEWKTYELGGKSNRKIPAADTEVAALFVEKFNGEGRPSQTLAECFSEVAGARAARRRSEADKVHATEWGGSISWKKFPQTRVGEKGVDSSEQDRRVGELSESARTVEQFGMCAWCTGQPATARGQLHNGDFWVGSDERGRARVALRLSGQNRIEEICGVLPHQSMEPQYAPVVTKMIEENSLIGGEKFVEDAVLKGKVANMKDPGSWDEFKQVVGKKTDAEAIEFYRSYRGPKGNADYLVGADNAALNRVLWEKTKHDGGDTPLQQVARRGQLSHAMKWIDSSMLDAPRITPSVGERARTSEFTQAPFLVSGGTQAHALLGEVRGDAGAAALGTLLKSGYLTPERQRAVDENGNSLARLVSLDGRKIGMLAEWEGLDGEAMRIPNNEGETGFMAAAEHGSKTSPQALEAMSKRGIMTAEDQRAQDFRGRNLFGHAAKIDKGGEGSALGRLVGRDWVDHSAIFVPSKDGRAPVAEITISGEEELRAIEFLRDGGHLTHDRQAAVDKDYNNLAHSLASQGQLGCLLGWSGLNGNAILAVNNDGKSPLSYHLGERQVIGERIAQAKEHLTEQSLLHGLEAPEGAVPSRFSKIKNGRAEPLIFEISRNGGIGHVLRSGIVTGDQISGVREEYTGAQRSPWHEMMLPEDFPQLVQDGTIAPRHIMTRDADDITAAMSLSSVRQVGGLISSGILTREVMDAEDAMGMRLGHHSTREGGFTRLIASGLLDRGDIEARTKEGKFMLHYFDGKPYGPDSFEAEKIKAAAESGILKSEDFSAEDPAGNMPLHDFAPSPRWMETLAEAGLIEKDALARRRRGAEPRARPLDLIPGKSSETIRLLAEKSLIDRETIVEKGHGFNSLLGKFIDAESQGENLVEGLKHLRRHCGLRSDDIGSHELHSAIWGRDSSERGAGNAVLGEMADAGFVTEKAIFEEDGHNPPLILGLMARRDGAEIFRTLLDKGLAPKSRISQTLPSGTKSGNLTGVILGYSAGSEAWTDLAIHAAKNGMIGKESLLTECAAGGKTRLVADMLFERGNARVLDAFIDSGMITRGDIEGKDGAGLLRAAVMGGRDALVTLSNRGLLRAGDLSSVEIDHWKGRQKAGHYLLEHDPEGFKELCEKGVVGDSDVFRGKGDGEPALEYAVSEGKLDALALCVRDGRRFSQHEIAGAWRESGRTGKTGELAEFLGKCGMNEGEIKESLRGVDQDGKKPIGRLAEWGADRLIPLARRNLLARKDLINGIGTELRTGTHDPISDVLKSQPENWGTLVEMGVLKPGDLYLRDSSFYLSPVRALVMRCEGAGGERAMAEKILSSGILMEKDGIILARDLSQNSGGGREALKTFVEKGAITREDLRTTFSGKSSLDRLVEASKTEGGSTLEFLRKHSAISPEDSPRVDRAISGEHSPIRDALDVVGGKILGLLGQRGREKVGDSAPPLRKGGFAIEDSVETRRATGPLR